MKLAEASFPHDAAKRIVIISDGNQNVGDALEQARALAEAGHRHRRGAHPLGRAGRSGRRKGDRSPPTCAAASRSICTSCSTTRPAEGDEPGRSRAGCKSFARPAIANKLISDRTSRWSRARRVFTVREEIDQPDFYTYEARFVPDDPADDAMPQNNQATTFTHVRGSGQVLLIEDYETSRRFRPDWSSGCGPMNLEVTVRSTQPEELFTDLAELQPFDTVMLANVPREHFSDEQIEMLVRNTQSMGSGLVMLGGPEQLRRRRLDQHAAGRSDAGRLSDQERQGRPDRRAGHADARLGNGRRQLLAKGDRPRSRSRRWATRTIAACCTGDCDEEWLWAPGMLKVGANRATRCWAGSTA